MAKWALLVSVAALAAVDSFAADANLDRLLESVEKRYNNARTLQVSFEESLSGSGPARIETGELVLRKPGRMRWDYRSPAGKLFVSDGKDIYYYSPFSRQAERMKLKESDDMRAPLAFLLGRLDFQKDFRDFRSTPQDSPQASGTMITATPKSDKLPYSQVEFLVTPEGRIAQLHVLGFDRSQLKFRFDNEKVNPPVNDAVFRFELPQGATWAEGSSGGHQ